MGGNLLRVFSCVLLALITSGSTSSSAATEVPCYGVHEVDFEGPTCGPADTPARDVELVTQWRHESGGTYTIHGFWDGDGTGGIRGNVFKVRFCPTSPGHWRLVRTTSNAAELNGQKEGLAIACTASHRPGFWEVDRTQMAGRWYQRSDGSHPYIFGNTMYTFLSERNNTGPSSGNIADDMRGNAEYFKKVRFSITGGRYPHPTAKPFLDNEGRPTDDGNFSHRPNPAWFHQRVDLAVRIAYEHDLIADLIINGPDTQENRAILRASANADDPTPILRYVAARYGGYPNVWFCLSNEFDIKTPKYTCDEINRFGQAMRRFLPYPAPMSVHAKPRDWYTKLNTNPPWHDHVIIQKKIKKLPIAADWVSRNHAMGGNVPVIDDELAYEGDGDGWSEADVIEAHLGAFLGGGYGTTGHKPANKQGHYFWGRFQASEHKAADNLLWLRQMIDEHITFWRMAPVDDSDPGDNAIAIFDNVHPGFRALAWPEHEFVLGTNRARTGIRVELPRGRWRVACYDALAKSREQLGREVSGTFVFDAPDSRATFVHFKRLDP
ncbi:MAG: DUF4038 domain-containing protein [Phycisphaerales bacterium]|nr:MAG: DUF4038 domain-containing protein [Phycisphaerales bacterium]